MIKKRTVKRALLVLLIALSGAGAGFVYYLFHSLPDIVVLEKERPSVKSIIYDRNNRNVGEFFLENRIIITYEDIPEHVRQAFIAVEDQHFYVHFGFDPMGITRAIITNLRKQGRVQGASTITQQLARNLFLTAEKSIVRKLKELILALKIESRFNKQEIITLYLNQIYLGSGCHGIEAACRKYFGKRVSEVSIPEAALLAALPKAPERYNPLKDPQLAKERRNIALKRMRAEGYIDDAAYQAAIQSPLVLRQSTRNAGSFAYFLEEIRRYIYANKALGSEMLLKGGLKIYSTMDADFQRIAYQALRRGLESYDRNRYAYTKPDAETLDMPERVTPELEMNYPARITSLRNKRIMVQVGDKQALVAPESLKWIHHNAFRYFTVDDVIEVRFTSLTAENGIYPVALTRTPVASGAVLIMDVNTGGITAMVGGYNFKKSEFNRAIQAFRQTGSAIKPLYYCAAIDNGFSQADMINDAPIRYWDISQEDYWEPRNYKGLYYGMVTLRQALARSINVASFKVMRNIGVDTAILYARKLGVNSKLQAVNSFALGSNEISLLEMVAAYNVFPAQGFYREPHYINIIFDAQDKVVDEQYGFSKKVIKKSTAYVMVDMLQAVVQSGTAARARNLPIPCAGKTGTTNNYTNAWFIGFTTDYTIGVWVGNEEETTLGDRRSADRVALPIWIDTVQGLLDKELLTAKDFQIPDGVVFRDICLDSGMLAGMTCPADRTERVAFIKGTEPFKECDEH